MKAWVIKLGRGKYMDELQQPAPLYEAWIFRTKAEALREIVTKGEEIVTQIEILDLGVNG